MRTRCFADITWDGVTWGGHSDGAASGGVRYGHRRARDAAVEMLEQAHREGRTLEGWQLDKAGAGGLYHGGRGFGEYFNHRLGA